MCMDDINANVFLFGTRDVEPELQFQAPAPTSESFWLRLHSDLVRWKRKTTVLFVQRAYPTN